MKHQTHTNRRATGLTSMILVLLVYVASTGPVVKLMDAGMMPQGIDPLIETVYAPLEWLTDVCEPVDDTLTWYVRDVWQCDLD